VNAYLWAGTVLLALLVLPGAVCVRGRPIDGVVALELCGAVVTTALLCLAEGFHRSVYFNVPLVAAGVTWIGGLLFVRLLGRYL
jgi:multicomponent Na+:H+ antiporter subunit F